MEEEDDAIPEKYSLGIRHVKKRALKNKALTIAFNDKDLRDYVTGFHKRKKKRRKIAEQQNQEKERLRRIEQRQKRKLERESALNGGPGAVENPVSSSGACRSDSEEDGDHAPISETTTYDNEDMIITVRTSEIIPEDNVIKAPQPATLIDTKADKKHHIPVKKKPFKSGKKPFKPSKKPKKRGAKQGGKRKGRNKG
ncbi:hypothetical protein AMTRI_Chr12g274350 [Amborella trichopoda]|uniref:Ribosomal RNA-processing protein 17 n=1 Tax=Amborella trichopoda TaxID=13333 RepID=W1PHU2_AMBTC|nr:ribosomal RNA-processing protein 17 [Amborella trichopoda]ERN07274.1 hypothetical protein AMTR_s00019p00205210 [Amborella trichopoda]|eukprot:XP_006845599.1 ribosomal RNA-processing protein 17 [Amborella trichopoda]